ncbi:hypothetical protein GX50_01606 [[Emmonsia] crescens]|uniref:Uncharacterized protein n=1 Tax=[Emmonsia] crescens TaxID=73230 RepID=A0A2B7ZGA8_9EURO|nr:hypothetical protein GX50_01606 [Emmonsia crescens]
MLTGHDIIATSLDLNQTLNPNFNLNLDPDLNPNSNPPPAYPLPSGRNSLSTPSSQTSHSGTLSFQPCTPTTTASSATSLSATAPPTPQSNDVDINLDDDTDTETDTTTLPTLPTSLHITTIHAFIGVSLGGATGPHLAPGRLQRTALHTYERLAWEDQFPSLVEIARINDKCDSYFDREDVR